MQRRNFIKSMIIGGAFSPSFSYLSAETSKPRNFIVILADDQGYQDLGCFGSPLIKTPHIDQMAREGMRFTDFYAQPLCGPSRAAFLTGCYPIRVGEYENKKRKFPYVHVKELLLPKILQETGYTTGMIGKVDITSRQKGWKPELNPIHRGFNYFYGTVGANDKGTPKEMYENEKKLDKLLSMNEFTRAYTEKAINFIQLNKDKPFFLYIAHTMPHIKIDASAEFKGKSKRGLYGDVIEELDWSTGQILKTLKRNKLDNNTLVVYTSDNGPYRVKNAVEERTAGSAHPLRGSKGTTWEGGMRVPCVMRAPGFIPSNKECHEVASLKDLLPTFIKIANGRIPENHIVDGKSFFPLMKGEKGAKSPHKAFYYYMESQLEAIRSGEWKLILPRKHVKDCPWLGRSRSYKKFVDNTFVPVPELLLFNLRDDVSETKNLANKYPEKVKEMMILIEQAYDDLGNFDRIGKGVHFYEDGEKWPDLKKWRK